MGDVTFKVKNIINEGVNVKLDSALGGDPTPKVRKVLLIEIRDWVTKSIKFEKKPLAINFEDKKVPIVVAKVSKNGHGYAQGVQKGMVLIEVNGEDISNMNYQDAL